MSDSANKVTAASLLALKQQGRPITALTAYDAPTAAMLEEAGADVLLVGDSVGNVKLGYKNTIPVSLEEILHHVKAVARGSSRPLLVADMPYLSYEIDPREAARNAGRLVKEGGAEAVKLEGGSEAAGAVQAILRANIPVMGHLGLTPQSVNRLGGYKVQGRTPKEASKILSDAKLLEKIGAFAIVLECVPESLAASVSRALKIPTIGIGAGPHCDGQILVTDDLLGLSRNSPKFAKRYAELRAASLQAVGQYLREVRGKSYPGREHSHAPAPKRPRSL